MSSIWAPICFFCSRIPVVLGFKMDANDSGTRKSTYLIMGKCLVHRGEDTILNIARI